MSNLSINNDQTRAIFDTIFGIGSSATLIITNDDKKKAALFLNELVEKSCLMSVPEGIFRSTFSLKPSLYGLVKSIISSFRKNCNKAVTEGKYYVSVRSTIAWKWKGAFEVRKQTGEW